nr:helix-turn-helix transcriptional regulator [Rhodococcus sp. (in: high G+C Gram-positive bacteria)]
MIDRDGLAAFLVDRRASLQPEDVGLRRGPRRRTAGLRREEVAELSHMSTDYYARLERGTGPRPSAEIIASIAQGLHLSLAERDHVFRLAGHTPPSRDAASEHVSPGLLRIMDRLQDTPAEVLTELGVTLCQTALGAALTGDAALRVGPSRSLGYRWFVDPTARNLYPPDERDFLSRLYVSGLREVVAVRGPESAAAKMVEVIGASSDEFRRLWALQEVGLRPPEIKRFDHPAVGRLELNCQTLMDPDQAHRLLVYTAVPGTESYEKLQLLGVLGVDSVL